MTGSTTEHTSRLTKLSYVLGGAIGLLVALAPSPLLWFFGVCVLVTLRWGVTRPRVLAIALVAGVVCIPDFMGWYVDGLGLINLPRVVMYSIACVLLFLRLSRGESEAQGGSPPIANSRLLTYSLLLLVGSWALMMVAGLLQGFSTGIRAANAILYQIIALWVGWRIVGDEEGLELLAVVLATTLILLVPVWLYEVLFGRSMFAGYVPPVEGLADSRWPLFRGGNVRAEAVFAHPLNFGQYLLLAIPMSISLFWRTRWRALAAFSTVAGIAGLLASLSRSPLLALVGGGVTIAFFRRPRATTAVLLAVGLTVWSVPGKGELIWNTLIVNPFSSEGDQGSAEFSEATEQRFSAIARVFVVQASVDAIRAEPFLGYGIGNISEGAGIPTIDNYFLRMAVESGIPAALCFMLGTLGVLCWLMLREPVQRSSRQLFVAMQVALAAYAFEWLLVGLRQTLPVFFLLLGVGIAVRTRAGRTSPGQQFVEA